MDLPSKLRGLQRELLEGAVLHLVLAAHLLHEELGVGHDLELVNARLERPLEACDKRTVLGDVVGSYADPLASCVEHGAVVRFEHEPVRGRTGVSARPAVGEQSGSQTSTSG